MNEYRQGAIFACEQLSKTKAEFKRNVMKVTKYTKSGFDACELSQATMLKFKK